MKIFIKKLYNIYHNYILIKGEKLETQTIL